MSLIDADNDIRINNGLIMLTRQIKERLQWPNPEYVKRMEAGRSTWNVPKEIVLWKQVGDYISVPFGMLQWFRFNGYGVMPTDHLMAHKTVFSGSVDNLYDYQEEAVERGLKAKNGVLVAPCGSGKTQIGLAMCARLGLNTLWLTHTQELLKQSMDRAKRYLDDVPMGTITNGKINAVTGITFATVQTMSKIDLSEFKDFWDVVIVDECHRCVGTPTQLTMFYRVVNSLSARYKYGLTATPKRADGMEKAMYALLGPKFYEITKEQVKGNTCPLCILEPKQTGWEPDLDACLNPDGTLNYTALITDCVENEDRNRIIANEINFAVAENGTTLVLSERVHHLELLAEMCQYKYGILSTAKKRYRQDLLQRLSNGEISVLFATYAIAKEGLDIPCLRNLVMASPVKDEITVTQSAGRVMRKYPDKECGCIWDFEDNMRMLQKWLQKRMAIYKKVNNNA